MLRNPHKDRGAYTTEAILVLALYLRSSDMDEASHEVRQFCLLHVDSALENDEKYLAPGARSGEATLTHAAWHIGSFLQDLGSYSRSIQLHERVVCLNEKSLGRKHRTILSNLSKMGGALYRLGRLDEAEKLLQEVLELKKRSFRNLSFEQVENNEHLSTLIRLTEKVSRCRKNKPRHSENKY